jgi:IclR family acetate operon transcriptional repressor
MAANIVERAFSIVELLARHPSGLGLTAIADQVTVPKSAAHRLLMELARLRYVRQDTETSRYHLSTRLLSLAFRHLAASGVVDLAQPVLEQLARQSGELARLAIVDGDRLTWVAKAQGARSGLRYDPDMGQEVALFCTATGQAWLASFDDEHALQLVSSQGFGRLDEFGPNAPRTVSRLLERLALARQQGYALVVESAGIGTSALAAVVRHPTTQQAIGTVSITGPSSRLTEQRLHELAPLVVAAADELSQASIGSDLLAEASRSARLHHRSTIKSQGA